jgi:PAS domain S-box-containing protein
MEPARTSPIDLVSEDGRASFETPEMSPTQMESLLAALGQFLAPMNVLPQSAPASFDENRQETRSEELVPSMDARYRVLVEQIPAVVFMAYLDGGVSEAYVSPHIERMLGFSREEWLDDPIRWYQQIHPDDRQRWSIEAAEMFVSGKSLKSIYRVIARDGRILWFHCEAKLVRRKDGQPWFIHGVGFDISELKQTEQALQQESAERERLQKLELDRQIAKTEQTESKLAAIVESSNDAIIGTNLDGVITSWNAGAKQMFGYPVDEIVGKTVLLLVPVELQNEELATLGRLRAGERIEHYNAERITKNGERVEVSLAISPIKDAEGKVIGASKIARDITERKSMEQALRTSEKYAAMGRVAAVLAHEISNPLAAVTNAFYLLRQHPSLDQEAQQLAEIAHTEITRVSHITKQTLGLYRQAERPTRVLLANLLDEILEVYGRQFQKLEVVLETKFSVEGEILGFPIEVRQVFVNLISNALQAMPSGGRLRVHLYESPSRTRTGPRAGVYVNVIDTGVGIPSEHREKLFQPFFTTKSEKGTGLGLWVSRGIVEKLEGSIRVRSLTIHSKSTTCFSVFLPGNVSKQ